jgi:S-adenosylmethionine:tRNA ribosyltransferase-isomerase
MDLFDVRNYQYTLPEELIAAEPLQQRDRSRLLVVNRKSQTWEHRIFSEIPSILDPGTVLVANNTRVIRARLLGEREGTGGKVEFFMLRRAEPGCWSGLMKTGARVVPGFRFRIPDREGGWVEGEVTGREESPAGVILTARFSRDPVEADIGEVPLPPYIVAKRKEWGPEELETYNTVFGTQAGSVAAPTAGRHFTPELINGLKAAGMDWQELTLHVGIGTFKPVSVPDVRDHVMHAEPVAISTDVAGMLNASKRAGKTVLAVGTTTTRALEGRSVAGPKGFELVPGVSDVNLFIHPGADYEWKFIDAMITNFHLPGSTLLMMIASFIGDLGFTRRVYEEAVRERYRFYSYGDAMLILDR